MIHWVLFLAITNSSAMLKAKSATSFVYEFKDKANCEQALIKLENKFSESNGICIEVRK